MRPPSPPSLSSHKLQARLHNWRLRQHQHYPSLFPTSLLPVNNPPLSLQNLRTGHSQLAFSGSPLLICDACAALIKLPTPTTSSSASTVSPGPVYEDSFTCDCGFTTPLGTMRYLFGLPSDRGPALEREVARALLVEAVGAPAAVKIKDKELADWILDPNCRTKGLFRLCHVLGLCEEEVGAIGKWHGYDAEMFLSKFPHEIMPPVPFSLHHLVGTTTERGDERQVLEMLERVRGIVVEGGNLWREGLSGEEMQKMRTLGERYVTERRKLRCYFHSERNAELVKVSPSRVHNSNREDEVAQRETLDRT